MNLRQLEYFIAIVEEKSFIKAAGKLHISQPSLSQSMKVLENELNTKLLERNNKTVRATDGGQLLYGHAKKIINDFRNMSIEIKDIHTLGNKKIYIGVLDFV